MIEHYTDHAANERTFLAWVRTAIAIMAFGFLVERFDLFLQITSQSLTGHSFAPGGHLVGKITGFLLILLGGAMMVLAITRFREAAKAIDDPGVHPGSGRRIDVTLTALLVLLGAVLSVYLAYTASRL
jgi:putative membrane protein